MNSLFSVQNKTILVTGASSGIGKGIVELLASQGASVILVARNEKRLKAVLESLPSNNHQYIVADLVSDEEIKKVASQLPILDGIILNAGVVKTVPVQFVKREDIDYMFNLMLHGSILLIQQLLKGKKIKLEGSICFISSVASKKITVGNAIYSAAKGAVNSFTKSLALELASKKIRVNAILPGMVQTSILDSGSISDEELQIHLKNYPLGRFGKPEDIAGLVIYLMSDISRWMTGSLLTIDGGYTLK